MEPTGPDKHDGYAVGYYSTQRRQYSLRRVVEAQAEVMLRAASVVIL